MTWANHLLFALMDFIMSSEPINKIIAYCWGYVIPYSIAYIGGMGRGTNWSICPGNIPAVNECVCVCVCVCFWVCLFILYYCTLSPGSCTWRVVPDSHLGMILASTYCEWNWQEFCHCNPFQIATDSALRHHGCSFHLSCQPLSKRERDAARDQELRS